MHGKPGERLGRHGASAIIAEHARRLNQGAPIGRLQRRTKQLSRSLRRHGHSLLRPPRRDRRPRPHRRALPGERRRRPYRRDGGLRCRGSSVTQLPWPIGSERPDVRAAGASLCLSRLRPPLVFQCGVRRPATGQRCPRARTRADRWPRADERAAGRRRRQAVVRRSWSPVPGARDRRSAEPSLGLRLALHPARQDDSPPGVSQSSYRRFKGR